MVLSSRLNLPLRIIVNLYLGALSITPWTLFPQRCNLWLAPNAHKCFGGLNSDISPSWCGAGDSQFQGATLNPSMPIPPSVLGLLLGSWHTEQPYILNITHSHMSSLWKFGFTRYLGNVIDFQSLKRMIVKNNCCNLSINHQSMTYFLLSLIYQCSVIYLSAIYLVYMYLSSILSLSSTIYYHLSITCIYVSINQSSLIYLSSIN